MKEQYQNAMQQITAPEALKQRTLQQMGRQFQQKPGRRTGDGRPCADGGRRAGADFAGAGPHADACRIVLH